MYRKVKHGEYSPCFLFLFYSFLFYYLFIIKVFKKGFEAVNREAISAEGALEWVQGVASGPGATQKETTKDYAVGYYLMTCCEWIEYCRETGENS